MYPKDLRFLNDLKRKNIGSKIYKVDNELDFSIIPEKPGSYILLSNKQRFIYPERTSKVIYIGMSINLRARIKNHFKNMNELNGIKKKYRREYWYYSRYNYLVKYGCRVYWMTTKGNPKNLESILIEKFYSKYHSIPIGNGAFSFKKVELRDL